MTKNLDKEGLSSIADNYQLFYVDLWGVVHNGVTLHLEAIKALKEINKKRKDYILLTNAPRPNHEVKSFLENYFKTRSSTPKTKVEEINPTPINPAIIPVLR